METIRKTVESKYAPKQTNIIWVDTSGDTPVEKHFIKGKWQVIGGGYGASYPNFSELETYYVGDKVTYNNKLYEFTETHEAGTWDETQVKEVSLTDIIDTSKMVEIHWKDLVDLRDNAKLVPGTWYRIIDYITTTADVNSMSAGHEFDVVVLALSNNTLSEDARAIRREHEENIYWDVTFSDGVTLKCSVVPYFDKHSSLASICIVNPDTKLGTVQYVMNIDSSTIDRNNKTFTVDIPSDSLVPIDYPQTSYFHNAKLEAWRLKYCLDNDKNRFGWAYNGSYTGVDFEEDGEKKSITFPNPILVGGNQTSYLSNWETTEDTFTDNRGNIMHKSVMYNVTFLSDVIQKLETCDNGEWTYTVSGTTSTYRSITIKFNDGSGSSAKTVYSYSTGTVTFDGISGWLNLGDFRNYTLYLYKPNTGNITTARIIRVKKTSIPCSMIVSEPGKGVIYRMIDEYNNDAPYDFKNIMFKLVKVTSDTRGFFNGTEYVLNTFNYSIGGFAKDETDYRWCYTFCSDDIVEDASIFSYAVYDRYFPRNNKIQETHYNKDNNSFGLYQNLNHIVLVQRGYSLLQDFNISPECYGLMVIGTQINITNALGASDRPKLLFVFADGSCSYLEISSSCKNCSFITNYEKTTFLDYRASTYNTKIFDCSLLPDCAHIYGTTYNSSTQVNEPLYYTMQQLINTIPSTEFTITTSGDIPDYITIDNTATSVVKGEPYIAKLTCTSPDTLGSHSIMMGDYNVTTSVWNSVDAQTAVIYIPAVTGNIIINANT